MARLKRPTIGESLRAAVEGAQEFKIPDRGPFADQYTTIYPQPRIDLTPNVKSSQLPRIRRK
jgi:hypothetical protein